MVYKFTQGYSITSQNMLAMISGLIYPKLYILGQNSQILCKNRKKLGKICRIRIFLMHNAYKKCKSLHSGGS